MKHLKTILLTLICLAALAAPALAGQGPEIRLTHSANGADQADVAVDSNGNVHIVYADADNSNKDRALWYTMLDNFGNTLIDDTPITPADDYDSTRPAIVVDSQAKVHIAWRDKRWNIDDNGDATTQEVTYTKLDPYLDDRDGGPADPAAITLVDDSQLTAIGNWYIYTIRMAVDSGDNVHIVWDDEDDYTINYMKLDENGNTLIAPTVLRTANQWRSTPEIAIDAQDKVHLVWSDGEDTSEEETYYMLLDGSDGSTLIDATRITPDDGYDSKWCSVVVDVYGRAHLTWQSKSGGLNHELYYTQLDPSLDDQDGGPADVAAITVVERKRLTANDGLKSRHLAMGTDGRTIHITWEEDDTDNLHYMILDQAGNIVLDNTALTNSDSVSPYNYWMLFRVAVDQGGTSHIVWTDSRDGGYEIYYSRYALAVDKNADDSTPMPGQRIDYTLVLRNGITTTTLSNVVVSDMLPVGLTFVGPVTMEPLQPGAVLAQNTGDLPTLASNLTLGFWQAVTLTFPVDVDLGTEAWTITNTAALSSAELITPELGVDVLNVLAPDVSVRQMASPSLLEPGQTLTFSIRFGNASSALTATNVILTNTIPFSLTGVSYSNSGAILTPLPGPDYAWQVEDLSPGEGGVITLTGTVDPALQTPGFIYNTALITTTGVSDGNPADNESTGLALVMQPDAMPELDTNTGRNLDLGQTAVISGAHLHASDTESNADSLTYTLRITPTYGTVQLDGAPLGAGDVFTQTLIDQERLTYAHDGSPSTDDSFGFSISDGPLSATWRVSVNLTGTQSNGNSYLPALAADGRYVAFESKASNLVLSDTNAMRDIFVHDYSSGQTVRVSVSSSGEQSDGSSYVPKLSADGRYVAFRSSAANLVLSDTNGFKDIFVHDLATGQTQRVSLSSAGVQANDNSDAPQISADGRYVVFDSSASNLVPGDNNKARDIFVHDRWTGQTQRVSLDSAGEQANDSSNKPDISADGRYVAFYSSASNLVDEDSNGERDVFVHDRATGQTELVSHSSSGEQGNAYSLYPALSADGRYVAFYSSASNLVDGDSNGYGDIFCHDRWTGQTERVSVSSSGEQGNNQSQHPALSADGRYVSFESDASNLVDGDTNGKDDIFCHDRQTGQTTRVSLAADGSQSNANSEYPAISGDGRYVAFYSAANNLVAGDSGQRDIFVHDQGGLRQGTFALRINLADLGIRKAATSSALLRPGDALTYTLLFSNNGHVTATNVIVTDTLPTGILNPTFSSNLAIVPNGDADTAWQVPDLLPGASGVITLNGVVDASLTGGPITNTVSITSVGGADGNPADNSATATAFVILSNEIPSVITNTGRTLALGANATLDRDHLYTSDVENGPDGLTYTLLSPPLYGQVLLDGTPLTVGDTFSQTLVDQFALSYLHDGSPTKDDAFSLSVGDSSESPIERVSVSSANVQASDNSEDAAISADGRYVAFASGASNLVTGHSGNWDDIFVRDRWTGQTTLVSLSSSGQAGNDHSYTPSISADGRYVAFSSSADNLVSGDTNSKLDIFVHDRLTGQTTCVSVNADGLVGNNGSLAPSISADGRYVAFESYANNLIPGDNNGVRDIFCHDRFNGQTSRVSVGSSGVEANRESKDAAISADGRTVAFISYASNLVDDDTNGAWDVFVHDRQTGQTSRVSVSSSGAQGDAGTQASVHLSAAGRYVAFSSDASNLVDGDTNGAWDVFVHDRQTGQTSRVSHSSSGEQGNAKSSWPQLSADGRYVVFESLASNLAPSDSNGKRDIFYHDRQTGQTSRISMAEDGAESDNDSYIPALSADGRYVAFDSYAGNLVSDDTLDWSDVFVRSLGQVAPVTVKLQMSIADVGIIKSVTPGIADAGATVTYTLDLHNSGYAPANNVIISDVLPSALFNPTFSSNLTITPSGAFSYTWQVPTLVAGQSVVITISGVFSPTLAQFTTITNTASITTAGQAESDPDNNSASVLLFGLDFDAIPSLTANTGLSLENGASAVISGTHLQLSDVENGPDWLTYTLYVTPAHGSLLLDGLPLASGAVLTQSAINQQRLTYSHDGGLSPQDSLSFIASDTALTPTQRVSVDSDGAQANDGSWGVSSISADGRYVAFESDASNLAPGDTNGEQDIFVHDRQTGQTTLISWDKDGQPSNEFSQHPSISTNGRYVAFASGASDLVDGDTNGATDVFVHDRQTGQTTLISWDKDGQPSNEFSQHPCISADGRYVAFASAASDLVAGDSNGVEDVFVHDRQTGQTTLVSMASNGAQGDDSSYYPALSANGRYVAFQSAANNLVAWDSNGETDVFVHDRQTGQTTLISWDKDGQPSDGNSHDSSISADGRYVAFQSGASDLVDGDANNWTDVFVHDRQTDQTTLISWDKDGQPSDSSSYAPSISADGRYVAFGSYASDLVANDSNDSEDVFVHDRQTGQTRLVSRNLSGQAGDNASYNPALSADGRYVAFQSYASDLVVGDSNNEQDVFVRDSGALWGSFVLDVGQVDVRLTKSVTPQIAAPGARVTYTLSFSNVGDIPVSGVLISDTIPVSVTSSSVVSSGVGGTVILPGTIILPGPTYMWTMQNLAPGEGGVITITGVLSSPLAAGAFANTASIAVGEVESDTLDNTSTATVTVTNVAPVADDDGFEVPQDSSGNPLDVLDGDSDANGNTLTVFAVGLPDHGGAAADNDTNILYTPALGFAGVEVFTYTVSDGNDGYASATVTVTITPANNAPLAVDDGYATDYETTLVVSATNGVLDNDTDPDGDPLTATLSSGPSNGTLALSLDGSFTYTPTASFTGLDGFSYVAWDGAPFASDALSDTATVVIGVGVIPSVTLTVAVDGTGSGTVEPGVGSHVYELNTVVTLTATADIGSEFVGWSDDVISTSNPVTITMTRSMTVTATFDQSGYGIYLPLVLRNQ